MRAAAQPVAEQWLAACVRRLAEPAMDRAAAQPVLVLIRSAHARWVGDLAMRIRQGITAAQLKRRPAPAAARPAAPRSLSDLTLVDEDQAEREIEVSRVIQVVDLEAEWVLRELVGLASALQVAHGEPMGLAQYPAGPAVYARAFGEMAQAMQLTPVQRAALMRAACAGAAEVLKAAYTEAAQQIRSWGVQEARYQRSAAPGSSQEARLSLGPSMQRLLSSPRLQAGGDDPSVALLARLFQEMLTDPRLNGPMRRVVARLQGTVQQTAQRDRSVLASQDHPVWQLIEQIASYAEEHGQPEDAAASDFMQFVEPLVDRLAAGPAPGREAYDQALGELRGYVAQDEAAELAREAEARRLLDQAEHEDALRPVLREQVQLSLRKAPQVGENLRLFLLGPWTDVMVHAVVHLGDGHAETQGMLSAVDELLSSLQPLQDAAQRQQRMRELPGLVARLQRGMQLVGMSKARAEAMLDELMDVHRKLLLAPTAAPTPEPAAPAAPAAPDTDIQWDDDDAYMREQPADRWGHSDTNLGHLPTVPMGLDAEAAGAAVAQWVKGLREGQRCKIFLQGQWVTARLMWQSENGGFFMFSSPLEGGSHSLTRRALERLRAEGLVTDLAEPSLLQRAVDSLMQDL